MGHRGISSAITTLFLIGVAVIGGLSAGTAMYEQNEIVTKSTKIDVVKTNLVHTLTANKTFFTLDLKNTGITTIASGTAGFYDNGNTFHSVQIPRLNPGQVFGTTEIFDANIHTNIKYLIHVKVLDTTGSSYEWVDTVAAR